MISRSLYFKLIKDGLRRRLWLISLLALTFFFSFPIAVAMICSSMRSNVSGYVSEWLSAINGLTIAITIISSVVCGMSAFSYLHSRTQTDFYHSLPIKRGRLFIINYITVFLIFAVTYLVGVLAGTFIAIANGISPGMIIGVASVSYVLHLCSFLLLYATVILAMMMTGNHVIAFLGILVLNFCFPIAVILAEGYKSIWLHSFCYLDGNLTSLYSSRVSPLLFCLDSIEYISDSGKMYSEFFIRSGIMVLAALVITFITLLIYRFRPSEAAGKAMAYKISRPVIKSILVVLFALGFFLLFWSIINNYAWAVFGLICGTVISHCIIEIIYHFDFKKLFSHKLCMAACGIVSALIVSIFVFDLFGYDSYLPDNDKIESVAISISRLDDSTSYGKVDVKSSSSPYDYWIHENSDEYRLDHMKLYDFSAVKSIAAEGIKKIKNKDEGSYQSDNSGHSVYSTICIQYNLKNGKKVRREYSSMNLIKIMEPVSELYAMKEYKEGVFPILSQTAEETYTVNYTERNSLTDLSLDDDSNAMLLEAYKSDLNALTTDTLMHESPVAMIQFETNDMKAAMDMLKSMNSSYYSYNLEKAFYPIYPSFEKTIALLNKQDIFPGPVEAKEIKSIAYEIYTYENFPYEDYSSEDYAYERDSYNTMSQAISGKDKIAKLAPCLVYIDYADINILRAFSRKVLTLYYVDNREPDGALYYLPLEFDSLLDE